MHTHTLPVRTELCYKCKCYSSWIQKRATTCITGSRLQWSGLLKDSTLNSQGVGYCFFFYHLDKGDKAVYGLVFVYFIDTAKLGFGNLRSISSKALGIFWTTIRIFWSNKAFYKILEARLYSCSKRLTVRQVFDKPCKTFYNSIVVKPSPINLSDLA